MYGSFRFFGTEGRDRQESLMDRRMNKVPKLPAVWHPQPAGSADHTASRRSQTPNCDQTAATTGASHWQRAGILFLSTTILITSACTGAREWWQNGFKVGPEFCGIPAETSADWIDSGAPELQSGASNYSHWWTVFNDPTLNELVYCAYMQNLPLKKASQQIAEARAMRAVAAGNLFAQQQRMQGGYSRNRLSSEAFPFGQFPIRKHFDNWVHGFDAAWELDIWGQIRRGIEAADANVNLQIENYDAALVMLQAEVAATYIQMRTLEQRLHVLQTNVEIQSKALELIEKRFESGLVSEIDVRQAKAIRESTKALIPTLQENHRKVQNALCVLLAMPPLELTEELGGSGVIPQAPREIVMGIPAELLRRRPDVRRAEFAAAAQSAQIGIAEAELYPHFAITGTIAFEAEHFSDLYGASAIAGNVGPGFRWNILNYGRILNNIDAQDAKFKQAIFDYQHTVLMANKEVEDAIVSYLREQERMATLKKAVDELEAALRLGLLLYEQGVVDYQRVLDSQRALVVQQDGLAESRGKIAINLVAVYKAIGGGWEARLSSFAEALPPVEPIMEDETAPFPQPAPTSPDDPSPAESNALQVPSGDDDATVTPEASTSENGVGRIPATDYTDPTGPH
jgi:NodT family efflux transporter outer membrane factor (OMF) lipoprotein